MSGDPGYATLFGRFRASFAGRSAGTWLHRVDGQVDTELVYRFIVDGSALESAGDTKIKLLESGASG